MICWFFILNFFFVFSIVFTLCIFKVLGASELPKEFVEKDGYCKLKFGDNFYYKEGVCKSGLETQPFLIEDFKEVCPDHKILSRGYNSKCFGLGKN